MVGLGGFAHRLMYFYMTADAQSLKVIPIEAKALHVVVGLSRLYWFPVMYVYCRTHAPFSQASLTEWMRLSISGS